MKTSSTANLGCGIAFVALASFGLVGTANADWSNPYGETGISGVGYFSNFGPGGQAAEFDAGHYEKINLGSITSTVWVAKPGAQGPMREDETGGTTAARQMRALEDCFGPVGGRNTP